MGVAIVLVVLIVGSVLFHFLSPWYFTPIASNWGTIDDDHQHHVLGHRRRSSLPSTCSWPTRSSDTATGTNRRAHYEPENKKLEWWLFWP